MTDLSDVRLAAASVVERAVVFDCEGESLVGVVSAPAQPQDVGVVIVVGGPQYRAGAHRQFVHLARHLAAAGHAVLRFDVRGMGDSSGAQRAFDTLSDDVAAAIAALKASQPAVRRVVLWGLCDGASAALIHAHERPDPGVCGLVLLNPWVRSAETLARTHLKHYYLQRLTQRDFWLKLLRGGIGVTAIGGLAGNIRQAQAAGGASAGSFQDRMYAGWKSFGHPVLVVLSGNDYTAKEFLEYVAARPDWQRLLERSGTTRVDVEDADHTFSGATARAAAEAATLRWLSAGPGRHQERA